MSRAKTLLKTYLDEMQTEGASRWVRKTELTEQPDGSVRRVIMRGDGTLEKDEIIPAERWAEIAASAEPANALDKNSRLKNERLTTGANVVILDPDVAEIFPDSASVNEALRALAGIINAQRKKGTQRGKTR